MCADVDLGLCCWVCVMAGGAPLLPGVLMALGGGCLEERAVCW